MLSVLERCRTRQQERAATEPGDRMSPGLLFSFSPVRSPAASEEAWCHDPQTAIAIPVLDSQSVNRTWYHKSLLCTTQPAHEVLNSSRTWTAEEEQLPARASSHDDPERRSFETLDGRGNRCDRGARTRGTDATRAFT
jgi:hypothetical protein